MKSFSPGHNTAVIMMEMINPSLSLLADVPDLHFVTRQGARLFPCLNKEGKADKYAAFMVAGDENDLPPDVRTDGIPFTFGATHGIAICFEITDPEIGAVVQRESVAHQMREAIEKLNQHIAKEAKHA